MAIPRGCSMRRAAWSAAPGSTPTSSRSIPRSSSGSTSSSSPWRVCCERARSRPTGCSSGAWSGFALWLADRMLASLREPDDTRSVVAAARGGSVLLALPGPYFGQREHLTLAMVLPWIIATAARARGRPPETADAVTAPGSWPASASRSSPTTCSCRSGSPSMAGSARRTAGSGSRRCTPRWRCSSACTPSRSSCLRAGLRGGDGPARLDLLGIRPSLARWPLLSGTLAAAHRLGRCCSGLAVRRPPAIRSWPTRSASPRPPLLPRWCSSTRASATTTTRRWARAAPAAHRAARRLRATLSPALRSWARRWRCWSPCPTRALPRHAAARAAGAGRSADRRRDAGAAASCGLIPRGAPVAGAVALDGGLLPAGARQPMRLGAQRYPSSGSCQRSTGTRSPPENDLPPFAR